MRSPFAVLLVASSLAFGACASSHGGGSDIGSIQRYLERNDVEEEIQRCIQRREVCVGMSKREVRLVMNELPQYNAYPTTVQHDDGRERWIYEPYPDGEVVTVLFSRGAVAHRQPF